MTLLHELSDFNDLLAVVGDMRKIDPGLVEKDDWIMHSLWGLQQLKYKFELKGGTSLSKGLGLIHRLTPSHRLALKRLAYMLGVARNHGKIGARGLIRLRASLLPVTQRTERDVIAQRKLFLRQRKRSA